MRGEPLGDDPTELPRLGDVLEFMQLIWALDHTLQSASKRMEATIGVTGPQRLALRIIGRFPGVSAGMLARILHVHPSTLTGVLKRLVDRGLVSRRADPRDARRSHLGLTARGREIDVPRSATVEAAVEETLSTLSAAKLAAGREVLLHLTEALSRLSTSPALREDLTDGAGSVFRAAARPGGRPRPSTRGVRDSRTGASRTHD